MCREPIPSQELTAQGVLHGKRASTLRRCLARRERQSAPVRYGASVMVVGVPCHAILA
ncbi:hypothetical protein SCANM124S_00131 [Streptomyces canus]